MKHSSKSTSTHPHVHHAAHGSASMLMLSVLATALLLGGCGGGASTEPQIAPQITTQPVNSTVTELQTAAFSVLASGTAPLTYQWRRNGVPVVGATAATLAMPTATAADHGARYSAVVTNSAGSATTADAVLTEELPVFLLAGQSNMEGNIDVPLYKALLAELTDGVAAGKQARLAEQIRVWHQVTNASANYGYTPAMAALEAAELVRLNTAGLVGTNLATPYAKVLCSKNTTAVAPLTTNCGNSFGPELVLGHALGQAGYSATSLIKVAVGGTTLYVNWRSPLSGGTVGPLYTQLRSRIQSLKTDPASVNPLCKLQTCKWSAFVWFQGENDSFDLANGTSYEENLRNLIADVRADVGLPNLPVVIVQTGRWAQSLTYGKNVADAQMKVVAADKYARMVATADLSGWYHYDPASQLIIGERVSKAVRSLLSAVPTP